MVNMKEGRFEKIIGIVILVAVIMSVVLLKSCSKDMKGKDGDLIYAAVGGGKDQKEDV